MSATELSGETLRRRIYDVLPAASYQLDRLLRLCDIVPTDAVATAAIECSTAPRLLVNPRFVDECCRRDEHLFLLVMHELMHVVLGHTRLFPRPTVAHNIAFDAVINAMLCRQFRDPVYAEFFQRVNDWQNFPARLLRPAPGWPEAPQPLPEDANDEERKLHARLYGDDAPNVTYAEIFELLAALLEQRSPRIEDAARRATTPGAEPLPGRSKGDQGIALPVLIGDHASGTDGGSSLDEHAATDATLQDVLRRMVKLWPPSARPLSGRDQGRNPSRWLVPKADNPGRAVRAAVRALLRKAGIRAEQGKSRRLRRTSGPTAVETVLPQLRDRRSAAFERLHGRRPLLFQGETLSIRARPETAIAHVYLDVSGSVWPVLPVFSSVLLAASRAGEARLFAFSTVIAEIRRFDSNPRIGNTGGTDLGCVLQHLEGIRRRSRPKHAVLITDGMVGRADALRVKRLGVRLHVGLLPPSSRADLQHVATTMVELPAIGKGGAQ
ncbi:MAG: VWA domain-containing protein [Planctomycetes bacterium]|nr:VWA domain-containing protein [Planctomycetota bacterium]